MVTLVRLRIVTGDMAAEEGSPDAVTAVGLKHKIDCVAPDAPLAILVHGRAGNFDVMWAFRRTLPVGVTIIAPQAPLADPIGGFSWWQPHEGDRGELSRGIGASGLLHSFIIRSIRFYNLTPPRMIAYGFSQGGALLSVLLQRPDTTLDGAALLASFVLRSADHSSVGGGRSVFIAHGTRDETVPIDLARTGASFLAERGYNVEFHEDPVTHKVGTAGIKALTNWSHRMVGSTAT